MVQGKCIVLTQSTDGTRYRYFVKPRFINRFCRNTRPQPPHPPYLCRWIWTLSVLYAPHLIRPIKIISDQTDDNLSQLYVLFTAPFLPRNIWINCAEIFSPSGPPSPTKKKKTSLLSPFVFNSTSHIVPKRRIESVFTASKRNFFYPCSFFFLFLSFFSSFC